MTRTLWKKGAEGYVADDGRQGPMEDFAKNSLDFNSVKNVVPQSLSQNQILEKFGEPNQKEKDGANERWRYLDPAPQFERVTFVFNESKTLIELHWEPLPGESEMKIEGIVAHYPSGHIKATNTRTTSHDSFETDTAYSDGSSMFVLNDDARKEVQAVGWFIPKPKPSVTPMTTR